MRNRLVDSLYLILFFIAGMAIGYFTAGMEGTQVKHISCLPGSPGVLTKIIQVDGVDYTCGCNRSGEFMLSELSAALKIPVSELRKLIREKRCTPFNPSSAIKVKKN